MRTLKELAVEANSIQNASNLCGVAQSFARAMIDLRHILQNTDDANHHPITQVWVDKLSALANTQNATLLEMHNAYETVDSLANQ
jgi:hypothetical protein